VHGEEGLAALSLLLEVALVRAQEVGAGHKAAEAALGPVLAIRAQAGEVSPHDIDFLIGEGIRVKVEPLWRKARVHRGLPFFRQ
jgi:hypothetical protein